MPENTPETRRPEVLHEVSPNAFEIVERKTGLWEKFYGNTVLRKAVLLVVLAALWEFYARWRNNPLTFPTLSETVTALVASLRTGALTRAVGASTILLLKGYGLGLLLAVALTAFASVSRIGSDLLETLTSMFHPLPSIALLPIAFIWFGLGTNGVVFVIVHAVLWSVALNTHAGFRAVSPTLRMVGRNYGLSTAGYISRILIPGAFPSILTGLKTGWAFAWRTLIAAELIFGASSEAGGLGWYIYEHKNQLLIPDVFAGLLTVMILGLAVENLVFKTVEKRTIRRWGMEN
jgi:NitT/TauT family transport system permease protein